MQVLIDNRDPAERIVLVSWNFACPDCLQWLLPVVEDDNAKTIYVECDRCGAEWRVAEKQYGRDIVLELERRSSAPAFPRRRSV